MAYKGLETKEREVVSHAVRQNKVAPHQKHISRCIIDEVNFKFSSDLYS